MRTPLLSYGVCPLLKHVVAARRGNDLDVFHAVEHRKRSNGRPVTPELIGVNDVWEVVIHQQPFKKGFSRVRVLVVLQHDIQHRAGLIDSPPQSVFPPTELDTPLVQEPSGTPPGFPMAELFGEERGKLDVPLAQGFVEEWRPHGRPFTTILTFWAALVQQFLNIALAQREAVVEPDSVLDDAQRKPPMAVRFAVSHEGSAYCA